ncbi:hypothetical protein KI387_029860, partial [Taxus chinensis]
FCRTLKRKQGIQLVADMCLAQTTNEIARVGVFFHINLKCIKAEGSSIGLIMFEQIMSSATFKQIAVFLDYDGPLSPIVDDPEKAFMSAEVYDFVQLAEIYYAGSHGMDIMAPARSFNGSKNCYTRTRDNEVLEIRPLIKWHKGDALEFLLESLDLSNSSDVIPLYIGDDRTDEDPVKVLKARGRGFSILVSSVPTETNASYSLRDPSE